LLQARIEDFAHLTRFSSQHKQGFLKIQVKNSPKFSLFCFLHTLSFFGQISFLLPLFFDKLSTRDLDLNTHFGGIMKITIDEVNQQEHAAKTLAANTHELISFY